MLLFVYLHPEPPYYPRQTLPPFGKRRLPLVSILIGEICYNLRSALDYLVYELAILDSSKRQDGTQFPIDDTPEKFSKHKRSWLKGLNSNHVAAIEKLQPRASGNPGATLRGSGSPLSRGRTELGRAAFHSITSSARRRNDSEIVRPSAFAVLRLMLGSNLTGCSTGSSAGLVPCRILWTYEAPRRNKSDRLAP